MVRSILRLTMRSTRKVSSQHQVRQTLQRALGISRESLSRLPLNREDSLRDLQKEQLPRWQNARFAEGWSSPRLSNDELSVIARRMAE